MVDTILALAGGLATVAGAAAAGYYGMELLGHVVARWFRG